MATQHANSSFENVLSLANAQARRRNVTAESYSVINDCRDIALKRITAVLSKTFDTIEDELFAMAESSYDRDTQNLYLDARAQAREKRGAIESSFRKKFLSFFENKVSGAPEKSGQPNSDFDFSTMSLVEDSDLEEKLAVDEISKRLSNKCDDELRALSQRMGFLMSQPDLNEDQNPMSPDTIIKALQSACEEMTTGYKSKLTVMRMVEQNMAKEMLSVYRDVNAHLVSRQIMPDTRPIYRRPQNNSARKPSGVSQGSSVANHAARQPGTPDLGAANSNSAGSSQDLFATLQQLMSANPMFDVNAITGRHSIVPSVSAGAHANSFAGVTKGASAMQTGASSEAPLSSEDLVSALSHIQQQLLANTAQFSAMTNMQNFVAGETPLASLNMLREVKEKSIGADGKQGNQIDGMTIDIVAMLFDYVFEDKAIPDTIKALLARLQIPVLKVAILDKTFFSKKSHPARRLLDVLAEASVCFAGQAHHADPLYQKIESLVNHIHVEFDADISIFVDALVDFEKFMSEREAASADMIEQSVRVLHDGEKREMARLIAVDEMERRAQELNLPAPVVAMLRGPWARVLERVYMRDGGRNQHFNDALEGADDLVWSVAPKMDSEGRKRLVSMLPSLLKRLQDGMEIAAVEHDDRERFFSALVDCHAAAVKAGLRGESVTSLLAGTQPVAAAAPLFEKLINEERAREALMKNAKRSGVARIQFTEQGIEIEEIVSQKSEDEVGSSQRQHGEETPEHGTQFAPILEGDAHAGVDSDSLDFDVTDVVPTELKRGTWVEFIHESGAKVRAKLTWISPLKGVYLFTSPGTTAALSVAPDALQAQFRRGLARIIEESSLVDRAVSRIVNSLSGGKVQTAG